MIFGPPPFWKIAAVLPSFSYRGVYTATTGTNNTFAGADIGTASATRFVVVVAHCEAASITGCTIGGVAATSLAYASADTETRIFGLAVAAGATADIVIQKSSSRHVCAGVYAVYDLLSTTPGDALEVDVNSATQSGTIDVLQDGIVIAGCGGASTNGETIAWTGVIETYDQGISGVNNKFGGAAQGSLAAETGRTIQSVMTNHGSGNESMAAVALR